MAQLVKDLPANVGDGSDMNSIPGLGKSPGDRNGNLLQYSCLENCMDRGVWQAIVHGVTKSWTQLSTHTHTHMHTNTHTHTQTHIHTHKLVGVHFLLRPFYLGSFTSVLFRSILPGISPPLLPVYSR